MPTLQPSRPARRHCARRDAHIVAALASNADGDIGNGLGQITAALGQGSLNVVSSTELLAAGGDTVVIGRTAPERRRRQLSQSANNFPVGGPPLGPLEQTASTSWRARSSSATETAIGSPANT